jgi:hypothetical protein
VTRVCGDTVQAGVTRGVCVCMTQHITPNSGSPGMCRMFVVTDSCCALLVVHPFCPGPYCALVMLTHTNIQHACWNAQQMCAAAAAAPST